MNLKIDEVDKRIIYRLSQDSRETTTAEIAEEVNVSSGTIRNRIKQLEEKGIIKGYIADIDYEKIEERIVNMFKCSSSVRDRSTLSKKALRVPGVVNVRELMTGERDVHIKAIGKNTEDLTQIATALENLGLEIEESDLIQEEYHHPYHPFGPEEEEMEPLVNLRGIVGDAEVADLVVKEGAEVEGRTIQEIKDKGVLPEDVLVIAVERGGEIVMAKGDTVLTKGDIVTLFSPNEISDDTLETITAG